MTVQGEGIKKMLQEEDKRLFFQDMYQIKCKTSEYDNGEDTASSDCI